MPIKLNIGSDIFKISGMINVDIRMSVHPDILMNIKKMGFRDKIAYEIHMGNVLEHISMEDVPQVLSECKRILIDRGIFYLTVPLVDVAQECYERKEITFESLNHIIHGEPEGYNHHRVEYRRGDIERVLLINGYRTEPLNINTYPYLVVSNVLNPKPDPWQYGVKAFKFGFQ
jgi:predicted SAM-dependent methyltransferase